MGPHAVDKPVDGASVSRSRDLLATGYDRGIPEGVVTVASREQLRALLAVSCPWCHAAAGEACSTMGQRRDGTEGPRRTNRRLIRTLDGGCHDARWLRALGEPAPVRVEVVAQEHPPRYGEAQEPVLIGAPAERPW